MTERQNGTVHATADGVSMHLRDHLPLPWKQYPKFVRTHANTIDRLNGALTLDEKVTVLTALSFLRGPNEDSTPTLEKTAKALGLSAPQVRDHIRVFEEQERLIAVVEQIGAWEDEEDVQKKRGRPKTRKTIEPTKLSQDLRSLVREALPLHLTPYQARVVTMALDGKNYVEIERQLHVDKSALATTVERSRRKLEPTVIFPAGYKRITTFPDYDRGLREAVQTGKLKAVKILHKWYTTDADYKRYQQQTDDFFSQGYVLLSGHATRSECRYILTYHPELIAKFNGSTYVKKGELERFKKEKRRSHVHLPDPRYIPVAAYANTRAEYRKLMAEIHGGKLQAVKIGTWWSVTPEAMGEYHRKRTTPLGKRTNGAAPVVVFDASKI